MNVIQSPALNIVKNVDTGGEEDFYVNTVVGSGDSPDGSTVPDTGAAAAPGFVDPALAKTAKDAHASAGETVTFTITVTNEGNLPAPNVFVKEFDPATNMYKKRVVVGAVLASVE